MADAKPDLIPEKPRIHAIRHAWDILALAVKKFSQIDGAHWAGAFAHYAFFALFPLIVLFVTIASLFIDRDRAGTEVIAYVKTYVPISGEMQKTIFSTLAGVVKARKQAGAIAFVILVLTAMQFFTALIAATNRAWGTTMNSLWRLPLKSLMMLGITIGVVLLGLATPVVMKLAKTWLLVFSDPGSAIFTMANF
ncbi:MAG: YihY/virulence factor BrkB family protein, partial [Chitinispirillaceae bacterium]|nr:YihY/virulence factor BrkB family protein [Chitinispirillaceae bacterium]